MPNVPITHFHLFCGLGGGAAGFQRAQARVGNLTAQMICLGGIDVDPVAVQNFEILAGVPGTCLDLFSREQYEAFHGHRPPAGWREATTADIHRAAAFQRPNICFLSAPCKGFSGLLAEAQSKTRKYQALNQLTVRGIMLMLEAWRNDPPEMLVFENVPRIQTRGRPLLNQIVAVLKDAGYAVAESRHNCGELGGMAQNRNRFLLVARHIDKVPPFLYEPPKRSLRGVGEILSQLPLPGDTDAGGPMHRIPELQWQTWVRLAFVEPGKDWRSLQRLRVGADGNLLDWALMPECRADYLGVCSWEQPSGVISSRGGPTNGKFSIADPRHTGPAKHSNEFRIVPWNEPGQCVSSAHGTGQCLADPRINGHDKSVQLGVRAWTEPMGTVTGNMVAGAGPHSIADPRPRYAGEYKQVKYRVTRHDEAAGTVIAASSTGNGAFAICDIAHTRPRQQHRPAAARPVNASAAIEHNRSLVFTAAELSAAQTTGDRIRLGSETSSTFHNALRVAPWQMPAGTITTSRSPGSGAINVADPRFINGNGEYANKLRVVRDSEAAPTVTTSNRIGSGALCIADPRPDCLFRESREGYATQGHYGVCDWGEPSNAVTGHAKYDRGKFAIADPRPLPSARDKLVCRIITPEGNWHRPMTTLELAALQSLVDPQNILTLHGKSDAQYREQIGNAVPPAAAEAIGSVFAQTLLLAWSGETFLLSSQPIWVQPLAISLAVDIPDYDRQFS